jgi:hypothetical protein
MLFLFCTLEYRNWWFKVAWAAKTLPRPLVVCCAGNFKSGYVYSISKSEKLALLRFPCMMKFIFINKERGSKELSADGADHRLHCSTRIRVARIKMNLDLNYPMNKGAGVKISNVKRITVVALKKE